MVNKRYTKKTQNLIILDPSMSRILINKKWFWCPICQNIKDWEELMIIISTMFMIEWDIKKINHLLFIEKILMLTMTQFKLKKILEMDSVKMTIYLSYLQKIWKKFKKSNASKKIQENLFSETKDITMIQLITIQSKNMDP